MTAKEITSRILALSAADPTFTKHGIEILDLISDFRKVKINAEDLQAVIDLHVHFIQIKGKKTASLEDEVARLMLFKIPAKIQANYTDTVAGKTVRTDQTEARAMFVTLLRHSIACAKSKDDKSKRSKLRIAQGLGLIYLTQTYFKVSGLKDLLFSKLADNDNEVSEAALDALENAFKYEHETELTPEEEAQISKHIGAAEDDGTVVSCCNIMLDAGKMDETSAQFIIDTWKERNWYN